MSGGNLSSGTGFSALSPFMDATSTLKRLGNDVDLFHQIILIYLEDSPELFATARNALANGDAASLRRAAHSLKGLAATMSAPQAVSAAFHLEQLGAAGDLADAPAALNELDLRLRELNSALAAYREQVEVADRQGHAMHSGS